MSHVLISSAGRRGDLVRVFKETQRLLGQGGSVFTIDHSPLTSAGWISDGLDLVPSVGDPNFIDSVLEVCARRGVRHVVPTNDLELRGYADTRSRFLEAGVDVWVSDPETIAVTQSKRLTNSWLRAQGLPVVRQLDLCDALSATDLNYPVIAKPASGSSSVGLVTIQRATDLETVDPSCDYVVEEIAPGVEYTVDVLVDDASGVMSAVPRKRLETRAGEVSKGLTVACKQVEDLAHEVVSSLPGARGVMNVQIFHDTASNSLHVIEINARFGGGFPLTWEAGAQMPLWRMQRASGIAPTASLAWRPGVLMLRYDAAVFMQLDPRDEL